MNQEKDMIEINLSSAPSYDAKEENYFGNISLARSIRDISLRLQEDHYEELESVTTKKRDTLDNFDYTDSKRIKSDDWQISKISCLRQLYCPNCQHRLEAPKRRYERLSTCCFPLLSISGIYRFCSNRVYSRKIMCNNCGSNLSTRKRP